MFAFSRRFALPLTILLLGLAFATTAAAQSFTVTHAKVSPRLRSLHEDKRWPDLLKKIGLAPSAL